MGTGVYGLSEEGRARFDRFPPLTADDQFVLQQFDRRERSTVREQHFLVHPPTTLRGLLAIRRRAYRGVAELEASGLARHEAATGSGRRLAELARSPRRWFAVVTYLAISLYAKASARWGNSSSSWERATDSARRGRRESKPDAARPSAGVGCPPLTHGLRRESLPRLVAHLHPTRDRVAPRGSAPRSTCTRFIAPCPRSCRGPTPRSSRRRSWCCRSHPRSSSAPTLWAFLRSPRAYLRTLRYALDAAPPGACAALAVLLLRRGDPRVESLPRSRRASPPCPLRERGFGRCLAGVPVRSLHRRRRRLVLELHDARLHGILGRRAIQPRPEGDSSRSGHRDQRLHAARNSWASSSPSTGTRSRSFTAGSIWPAIRSPTGKDAAAVRWRSCAWAVSLRRRARRSCCARSPRVRANGKSVCLTLVGDGPLRHQLEAEARQLGIVEHVTFAGAVDQDVIPSFYERADVFCQPSFMEGIPVVLMEAMATGLPVVSSGVAGIRSWLWRIAPDSWSLRADRHCWRLRSAGWWTRRRNGVHSERLAGRSWSRSSTPTGALPCGGSLRPPRPSLMPSRPSVVERRPRSPANRH